MQAQIDERLVSTARACAKCPLIFMNRKIKVIGGNSGRGVTPDTFSV